MSELAKRAKSIFRNLRKIPEAEWKGLSDVEKFKKVSAYLEDPKAFEGGEQEAGSFMGVLVKVVHKCDEEQFVEFVEKGELPPVKLSTKEMEILAGGCFPGGRIGGSHKYKELGGGWGGGSTKAIGEEGGGTPSGGGWGGGTTKALSEAVGSFPGRMTSQAMGEEGTKPPVQTGGSAGGREPWPWVRAFKS